MRRARRPPAEPKRRLRHPLNSRARPPHSLFRGAFDSRVENKPQDTGREALQPCVDHQSKRRTLAAESAGSLVSARHFRRSMIDAFEFALRLTRNILAEAQHTRDKAVEKGKPDI